MDTFDDFQSKIVIVDRPRHRRDLVNCHQGHFIRLHHLHRLHLLQTRQSGGLHHLCVTLAISGMPPGLYHRRRLHFLLPHQDPRR